MKIFVFDRSVWPAELTSLSPVLRVHWDGITPEARLAGARNARSPFVLVDDPGVADIHLLPREWHYYLAGGRIPEAQRDGALAAAHGKSLLVWHSGDLEPVIPIPNAVMFQQALYRSRLKPSQRAAPSFEADPLARAGGGLRPRPKRSRPSVGFCGYAGVVPAKIAYGVASAAVHNLKSWAGRSPYRPIPLVPATMLRARALRALQADTRIDTRFVINRRAFKRHDTRNEAEQRAAQMAAFQENVLDTDYTVCIRGYGNWSRRFYETLACGRIPVFIDTDCVLPGEGRIDWRRYCVWIEPADRARVADRILEFHHRLSADAFVETQRACRRLWEDWLSTAGFMDHLASDWAPAVRACIAGAEDSQDAAAPRHRSGAPLGSEMRPALPSPSSRGPV